MIQIKRGQVVEILEESARICVAKVSVEGETAKAVHFPAIGGALRVGQNVTLNTTAQCLHLGTGGYHFILHVDGNDAVDTLTPGHIMKLRYTPYQIQVLSVEEEASPHHQVLAEMEAVAGMPVIAAPLHSMVLPIAAVLRELAPEIRIAYLMSDGAALPLAFSKTIRSLKERNWLAGTVTFGHAFGGDLEAVNVYTALLAARWVLHAQVAIVGMGPGIVGTGTPYGFSGIEQADFLHAAHLLQGDPIAVPRISFTDTRSRHQGISHHSRTVLGKLSLVRCKIAVPVLDSWKGKMVRQQLAESGILQKHQVMECSAAQVAEVLQRYEAELQTMGRGYREEKEFFLTAGLAAEVALKSLNMVCQ